MWFIQMVFLLTWFFSAYKIVVKINVDVWFEFNVDTYVGSIIPRPLSYEEVVNALQWEFSSNSVDQLWIKIKNTQFASKFRDGKEIVCFTCIYIIVHKKNMTTQLRLETRINWHYNGSIYIIDPWWSNLIENPVYISGRDHVSHAY